MYKINLKVPQLTHPTRDDIVWSQCRFLPRFSVGKEDPMSRNTSLSSVYLEDEQVDVTYGAQTPNQEYAQYETTAKCSREDSRVIQDQATTANQDDNSLKMMKARLRSKYQLYTETLPPNPSGLQLEEAETAVDLGKDNFFGICEDDLGNDSKTEFVGTDEMPQEADAARHTRTMKRLSNDELYEKHWQPLTEKENRSKEKLLQAPYGLIRMDEDNQRAKSRKRGHSKLDILNSTGEVERGITNTDQNTHISDFPDKHSDVTEFDRDQRKKGLKSDTLRSCNGEMSGTEFIDQQYFSHDGAHKILGDSPQISSEPNNGESYIESQYFPDQTGQGSVPLTDISEKYIERQTFSEKVKQGLVPLADIGEQLIEKQYFPQKMGEESAPPTDIGEQLIERQYFSQKTGKVSAPLTDFGEQYLSGTTESTHETETSTFTNHRDTKASPGVNNYRETEIQEKLIPKRKDRVKPSEILVDHKTNDFPRSVNYEVRTAKEDFSREISTEDHNDDFVKSNDEVIVEKTAKAKQRQKTNLEKPQTAYDLAIKIRQERKGRLQAPEDRKIAHESLKNWKGKLDSKGFRILKDQVPNLEYVQREAVVDMLKSSIIFQNDDLIVIDKPYGLPSHGGPGVHHSVGGLLPLLADRIRNQNQPLHLIHRLDKETTGVMLLGKNAEVTWKIHGMFKRREVSKTYWALTKGVPNPRSGVIDIPMAEDEVKGRYRMGLRPYRDENTKLLQGKAKSVKKFEAVTEYKVLSFISTAALVQCTPRTGVKHQIRCHLAFGLNSPIIGDHKYSHFSFIKPQKLHPETLNRLKIRQPTARYLPMHLHARELVLPEFYEGKNTIFRSKLPEFFVRNMRWLKLAIPK